MWIGTSGFPYPEWKGGFYPADLSVAKMLGYYSERFSTTETNYTFRQIQKETTVAKWPVVSGVIEAAAMSAQIRGTEPD